MRVEDGREIPAGQRTVNLCHGQGAKIHLFYSIRPPLRSHTTLTVANVICFIHRPCVCVSASEKSWYAEWNKKKMFCYVMDFAVISRLYIFYGFTLNAVDFSHFQETFHLLDSISTPGETALCAPSTMSGWIPSSTFRYFTLGRTPWEFKCFYVKI